MAEVLQYFIQKWTVQMKEKVKGEGFEESEIGKWKWKSENRFFVPNDKVLANLQK